MPISNKNIPTNNLVFNQVKINEIATHDPTAIDVHAAEQENNLHPPSETELKNKIISDYQQGIEDLSKILDQDTDQQNVTALKKFSADVTNGINGHYSITVRQEYMTQVKQDFDLICTLAQDKTLPADMRRQTVLALSKGLAVCSAGVSQNIEAVARELKALKLGLPQDFVNRLNRLIDNESLSFIEKNKLCPHKGNEIHYAAALFNHIASHFGLPIREDDFIKNNVYITQKQLSSFENNILENITLENVIVDMAQDCLTQTKDHFASIHPDVRTSSFDINIFGNLYTEYQDKLKPLLENSYGPVALENIIFTCADDSNNERYLITEDHTLIAKSIARNLRNAGIANSFKATHILGEKGQEITIKQLGQNLVYVSKTLPVPNGEKPEHIHSTLEQFIWEDSEKGLELINHLKEASISNPLLKSVQDDHLEKMPVFLVQQMRAALSAASEPARGMHDAKEVLNHPILSSIQEDDGTTILVNAFDYAKNSKQPDIAKILLEKISLKRLGIKADDDGTMLFPLIDLDQTIIVKILIEKFDQKQLSAKNGDGSTALIHTIKKKKIDLANLLTEKMSTKQIGITDENGDTALTLSYENKVPLDTIKMLFAKSSPEQLDIKNIGHRLLMTSINEKEIEFTELLIKKMSPEQLCIADQNGNTALIHALYKSPQHIIKMLIDKTDSPHTNVIDNININALRHATKQELFNISNILREKIISQGPKASLEEAINMVRRRNAHINNIKNLISQTENSEKPKENISKFRRMKSVFSSAFKIFSSPVILLKKIYAWWNNSPAG